MNVLVIDDDSFFHTLVKFNLKKKLTCNLVSCFDGQAALDLIQNQSFDIILCDYEMPILNGFETIKRIRSNNKTSKIIAVSSSNRNNELMIESGANDSFNKLDLAKKADLLVNKISSLFLSR
jgi:CheY-like chemotaxis protein